MTMRVLLVEDRADFARTVEQAVRPISNCELVWVASRDEAISRATAETFDLIILDRRIPSADGVLDDHAEHGWRVFQFIKETLPGTPVWFLTGSEDADFAMDINNSHGKIEDIHARHVSEQMYRVWWKRRISDCIKDVRNFAEQRSALDKIAIRRHPVSLEINDQEACTIRMFARRHNGALLDVTALSGGLSDSRVLKIEVREANEAALMTAVAKVASILQIREEATRFHRDIVRLAPGGFPPLTEQIEVGAGNVGGLFYGMVGSTVESLFSRIAGGHPGVANVPADLHRIEGTWYQAKQEHVVPVAHVRRRLVSDTTLYQIKPQLGEINITAIEARPVKVAQCVQHGDLHCANVVFDQRGQAMLIDFGDTGPSLASIDPLTLELSTIFHSQHDTLLPGWPTNTNVDQWVNAERFTEGCVFASFIRACREWALAEAASSDEVIAVAYAYALRQLKYPDTNKDLARALISACLSYFAAVPS